jgi:3-oxoacyl-[acyl-carrier-protein] synthase-3
MKHKESKFKIGIIGIGSSLPKKIITASEISLLSGFSVEEIVGKLGFHQKRVASAQEHPSKFALSAAKKAMRHANINSKDLDFIIYSSNGIHDFQFWSPSAHIQHALKATNAISFEVNHGCNSAIAGMYLAKCLLSKRSCNIGLVVISDTLSKFIDYRDKCSFPLFSMADGASAVVISNNSDSNTIKSQTIFTDGKFAQCNKLILGGTKCLDIANSDKSNYITVNLNGKETRSLRENAMADNYIKVIKDAIRKANLQLKDISHFLFNQNSISILNDVISNLGIPKSKVYSIRENYGHIAAIDTLFALEKLINKKLVHKNDLVLLATAGIGYHWGAQIIEI